mmetsp:Transcript_28476/g.51484  ORF Transcript_28476/g.51484 Transcript_28476/m.51484 type:complete len:502 (-) Transcript_28476:106-1611(-)|eukprot:CAMPEP_0197655532 /NCGR_PEP_ID=MMETSP1338-20131121/39503_1 /TAXON_ID=43686 ORGANISM="Pelagodinium beii, Strain RCC1491" /NCGR_SAMPLE_ID=MMETSP1338 /ASSEMBLY_ACC=CAM_ASM_000754 /LENGTH=501 /DNA_ID=CAMNT_0043231187 /DNA_START=45 /DNA_END=1550 /DNA_ORIENTATION=+
MFSTSVLECQKALNSAAPATAVAEAEESAKPGRVQRHGLYSSDKENRPLMPMTATKRNSSGALWEQQREVDCLKAKLAHEEKLRLQAEGQLSEMRGNKRSVAEMRSLTEFQAQRISELETRCKNLDDMQQEAQIQAKQETLRASDLEASLLERTRELKKEKHCKVAEAEAMLTIKSEKLTAMQTELAELTRRTIFNEARLKRHQEALVIDDSSPGCCGPEGLAVSEHHRLVSRVVHCAVIKALVAEESVPRLLLADEVQQTLRSELAKAEAEAQAARADEFRQLEKTCLNKVQLGIQVAELQGREEQLLAQSRQLADTNSMLKQECECLRAENHGLKDTVVMFEESLEKVSCQHAELAGHANHRQKIRHMQQLKDDREHLRSENQQLRLRLKRAEASSCNRNLYEAMSGAMESVPSSKLGKTIPRTGAVAEGSEPARCMRLEQDLERATINFRHLLDLIEFAVSMGGRTGASELGIAGLLEELRQLVTRHRSMSSAEPGRA